MTSPSPTDVITGDRLRTVKAHREVTADLIRLEGVMVSLWRAPQAVADGAGGFLPGSGSPAPLAAVKRFFSLSQYEPLDMSNQQGEYLPERFILIGLYTDDIKEGDYLLYQGKKFTITFIHPDRTYQVKAEGACFSDGR